MFTDEIVSKIYEIFGNKEDVFKKQYIDLDTSKNKMEAQDIVNHVFLYFKRRKNKKSDQSIVFK